jgi:uncharacterized protein YndB with AHSA1/START domain/uncharacterized protein YciI
MSEKRHFIGQLHGVREGWPRDMSDEEQRVMSEHFVYLRRLTWAGKVLLAGPVAETYGLVALETASEDEANAIMAADPSVKEGLHTYTLHNFPASLLPGRDRSAGGVRKDTIEKRVALDAPRRQVWEAWTTAAGLKSFFAPHVNVELRVGGPFEIFFAPPESPAGLRGAEGCRVLAFSPEEMLAFSWNAPPGFPEIRPQRTQVVLFFEDGEGGGTRLRLVNHGYGEGEQWDAVFEYFDLAWTHVLDNLEKSFAG